MCVLATVLGAIDRGDPVTVVTDALCSSCNQTHDAMMTLSGHRFDTRSTDAVLRAWS